MRDNHPKLTIIFSKCSTLCSWSKLLRRQYNKFDTLTLRHFDTLRPELRSRKELKLPKIGHKLKEQIFINDSIGLIVQGGTLHPSASQVTTTE